MTLYSRYKSFKISNLNCDNSNIFRFIWKGFFIILVFLKFEPRGVWFDLNSYTRMLSTFLWNWPGYYWRKRRDTPPGSLLARILSKFWGPNVKIFSTAFFVLSAREHSYRLWIAWMQAALHSTFKVLPALTAALW